MKELDQLYRNIYPNIYAFFYIKTSDKSVAEDLSQDVFYEACKSIHLYQGNSTLKTWIFSIAKNILKKYYRSKKYQQTLEANLKQQTSPSVKTPEEYLFLQEETQTLVNIIRQLDDQKKEIAILRIYGELSFKEIGELINKTENYARVIFHRIKLQIKMEMEGEK